MRLLIVHNYYQQPGGEDAVFVAEKTLLRRYGHEMVEYTDNNRRINGMSPLAVAAQAVWSRSSRKQLFPLLRDARPDVVHFHNAFWLISPSAYFACQKMNVPVVQTLHNYRLLCPTATFYRGGQVCEECMAKILPWRGARHACYRGSRARTAVVSAMLTIHRRLKTWQKQVDIYIALTEFARQKFIKGGIPSDKIVVKPNFIHPDPRPNNTAGNYVIFIGRLSPEKGLRTLLKAWRNLKGIPLKLVGDGPLMTEVQKEAGALPNVEVLGWREYEGTIALFKGARLLVFPSEWYETFGRVAVEAFACGVPVVASRLGAMAEIIDDGRTGLLFEPGDSRDLASKVRWLFEHPEKAKAMGRNARAEYEKKYTPELNYKMLLRIYEMAIENSKCTTHIS